MQSLFRTKKIVIKEINNNNEYKRRGPHWCRRNVALKYADAIRTPVRVHIVLYLFHFAIMVYPDPPFYFLICSLWCLLQSTIIIISRHWNGMHQKFNKNTNLTQQSSNLRMNEIDEILFKSVCHYRRNIVEFQKGAEGIMSQSEIEWQSHRIIGFDIFFHSQP